MHHNLWRGQDCYGLLDIFFQYKNNVGLHLWKFISVQVWNAVAGNKLYTFEGHKAPSYSMCPHNKENLHVCSCFICNFASWKFFKLFMRDFQGLFSCLSQNVRLRLLFIIKQLHLNILVHLFYTKAMLAKWGQGAHALISTLIRGNRFLHCFCFVKKDFFFPSDLFSLLSLITRMINIYCNFHGTKNGKFEA